MDPRALARRMEHRRQLPAGPEERFAGFGVMGLPFISGHLLAFGRMTASSVGEPHTTIWHRRPSGEWTVFTDLEPSVPCPRYLGVEGERVVRGEIEVGWEGRYELSLRMSETRFQWGVRLSEDWWTRGLSAVGRVAPDFVWRNAAVLDAMGDLGGAALGLGKLALRGRTPKGDRFRVAPRRLWRVEATAAILDREDLGEMGPLGEQARLGDFWVPNAGVFALGTAWLTPVPRDDLPAAARGPEAEAAVPERDGMDGFNRNGWKENDRRRGS